MIPGRPQPTRRLTVGRASTKRPSRRALGLSLLAFVACTGPTLRKEVTRDEPTYASPPAAHGPLAELADEISARHGPEASGFHLLDYSYDGLSWRLALVDSAVSSVDIQTYLWYPDASGRLMLNRAIQAAERGVRVRLIVDDLLTAGLDQVLYELHRHPGVEIRLFNPWQRRGSLSRLGEVIARMERLNVRMHDKLMIADGRAAIVGGRNLGDHYFGLSEAYNFHDLDVLGVGHLAQQANAMFDHFWNSEWVVSADNLVLKPDPEAARERRDEMVARIGAAHELDSFPKEPVDWRGDFAWLREVLHPGTSVLIHDEALKEEILPNVALELFSWMGRAQQELLVTNAYIIPQQRGIEFVRSLTERGVRVRILTNSLASHDVPAVNSHYRAWRDDFIRAGAELYELRADPEIQTLVDVPPASGEFTGLHTKAFVVDRRFAFIGSMNFDPRSIEINAEAGAFIDSPGLAAELARVMERDMSPENAWQVFLDEDGDVYWVNSEETVTRQPSRNSSQRVMDTIFRMFPKDQF